MRQVSLSGYESDKVLPGIKVRRFAIATATNSVTRRQSGAMLRDALFRQCCSLQEIDGSFARNRKWRVTDSGEKTGTYKKLTDTRKELVEFKSEASNCAQSL